MECPNITATNFNTVTMKKKQNMSNRLSIKVEKIDIEVKVKVLEQIKVLEGYANLAIIATIIGEENAIFFMMKLQVRDINH